MKKKPRQQREKDYDSFSILPLDMILEILEYNVLIFQQHYLESIATSDEPNRSVLTRLFFGYQQSDSKRTIFLLFPCINFFREYTTESMIVPSLVLPKDVVYLESTCLGGGYGRFNNLEQLIVDNATPEEIVMLPKLKTLSFVSSARRMRAKNQHYNDAVLLPNLTKLCLQDCQINQTIVEEIFKLENIKELDITRTHFTLQLGPQVIIPKSLRALALEECCSNTPGAMSHNIKNLTIDTCRDHSGLCCLIEENHTIKSLVLNFCFTLDKDLCSKIAQLSLEKLVLTVLSGHMMVRKMFENTPMLSSLKHLSLRGNMQIPQFEIETMPLLKSVMVDSVSPQFLTSIGKHDSLTEISLENCQLSEDQVRFILSNNKLKSLRLSRNNLTNQDIACMASNSSIETLRLRQPAVTEDGLVQILRGNNMLKELYIENAACTELFFDAVAETDQLEHLQCSTPVECFKYATGAIKNCKNMKSFKFIRCARSN